MTTTKAKKKKKTVSRVGVKEEQILQVRQNSQEAVKMTNTISGNSGSTTRSSSLTKQFIHEKHLYLYELAESDEQSAMAPHDAMRKSPQSAVKKGERCMKSDFK